MNCINLKERFGKKYRVRYEESFHAQHGQSVRVDDPWLQIIPCKRGHISPWGASTLAASTNGRGLTVRRLMALPGVTVHQDGSDGATVLFPVDRFPNVAKLMKPHRKPQLTEEQKALARERLAKFAFPPAMKRCSESAVCVQTV